MRPFIRLAVLATVAVTAAAGPLAAQQPVTSAPRDAFVSTSGEGETRVTPDRATIFLGVQTRAATAAAAGAENARKQRAVLDTLRAMGIAAADISTSGYNVFPERSYDPQRGDKAPRVVAYNVSNMVRVEVRRLEILGTLLDAVLAKGANEVSSLQFTASNTDDARRSALAAAVARAQADAEAMARGAGRCIDELQELSTDQAVRPVAFEGMRSMRAEAAQSPTPITPGEQTLTVTVHGRWRLRPSGTVCGGR